MNNFKTFLLGTGASPVPISLPPEVTTPTLDYTMRYNRVPISDDISSFQSLLHQHLVYSLGDVGVSIYLRGPGGNSIKDSGKAMPRKEKITKQL